jgi:putative methyltransferase (TIGR04325 family)
MMSNVPARKTKNAASSIVREFLPPVFIRLYRSLFGKTGYIGPFPTWRDARKRSSGYDSLEIIRKTAESARKVRDGDAVYERDSVLFDRIEYSWPLLAGLLWIASQKENRLNLVDFGGSLGSSYYQNRKFLTHLKELRWSIVEQETVVECGKREFETGHMKFYANLEECYREQGPDAILFSSSLQYLEEPYAMLQKVLSLGFEFILFDRTPLIDKGEDRIVVQKVPREIYNASYPVWFFGRHRFLTCLSRGYELFEEFDALSGTFHLPGGAAVDKGLIFRKKKVPLSESVPC